MNIPLNSLRKLIRESIVRAILEDFEAKEMTEGSSWRVGKSNAWAAKNKNGVVNYWYGDDDEKNKKKANEFKNDSTKTKKSK